MKIHWWLLLSCSMMPGCSDDTEQGQRESPVSRFEEDTLTLQDQMDRLHEHMTRDVDANQGEPDPRLQYQLDLLVALQESPFFLVDGAIEVQNEEQSSSSQRRELEIVQEAASAVEWVSIFNGAKVAVIENNDDPFVLFEGRSYADPTILGGGPFALRVHFHRNTGEIGRIVSY